LDKLNTFILGKSGQHFATTSVVAGMIKQEDIRESQAREIARMTAHASGSKKAVSRVQWQKEVGAIS
jgi:hypothetical protein